MSRGEYWHILFFPFRLNESLIGLIFTLWIFYSFGTELEATMGKARYNQFIFLGIISILIGAILLPGLVYARYLYFSVFFGMAFRNPHVQIYIFMILPLSLWIVAAALAAFIMYPVVQIFLLTGNPLVFLSPVFGLLNLIYFFVPDYIRGQRREVQTTARKKKFTVINTAALHKCEVCGRTEITNPELEFRFCEECSGDREYCSEHLHTHEHI